MPDLLALAAFVDALLETNSYPTAEDTLYRHSVRPVGRLGLAVEADFDAKEWAEAQHLDAVFLHRPWKLDTQTLPPDIGVLSAHLPFDDHLTLGVNPRLAAVLGLTAWEPFGDKAGRPLGMLGRVSPAPFDTLQARLQDIFGGLDCARAGKAGRENITSITVVNAMTDTLVREAAACGAQLYVTGQERAGARDAVEETGIGIAAVGHARCEQWGLRALAGPLRERWTALTVCVRE